MQSLERVRTLQELNTTYKECSSIGTVRAEAMVVVEFRCFRLTSLIRSTDTATKTHSSPAQTDSPWLPKPLEAAKEIEEGLSETTIHKAICYWIATTRRIRQEVKETDFR